MTILTYFGYFQLKQNLYLYVITVFETNRKHLYFILCLKLSISDLPTCGFYLRHDLEDCAEFCNRNRFGY